MHVRRMGLGQQDHLVVLSMCLTWFQKSEECVCLP